MDAVITYVNMADPLWQEDYKTTGNELNVKRFRDWGTLPFLLRGIETCLPFIEKVHLIVSRPSQVPEGLGGPVRIVLHSDIIPQEYLPTFNSTVIEMFLHRIPGLAEEFLYFNDDMFPLLPCAPEDFFPESGKIAIGFSRHLIAGNLYKKQTRNADRLALKALGKRPAPWFLRPQHVPTPMLRSVSEKAFQAVENEILAALTPLRDGRNVNQYFFPDYLYHSGNALNRRLSNRHFSLATASPGELLAFLQHPTRSFTCINDVRIPETKAEQLRNAMLEGFRTRFPVRSRFEVDPDQA